MNSYRILVIFVEGQDDTQFVESVLIPLVESSFDHVEVEEYAQKVPSKVNGYISGIKFRQGSDYIFIADFDQGPCITRRKSQLMNQFSSLDSERILIVRREIESWYLAGLNSDSCRDLGIQEPRQTNDLTKEQFDAIIPQRFDNRTDFMVETLNRYDTNTARRKNESFDYAMEAERFPFA